MSEPISKKLKCPNCGFEGEFKQMKVPFFVLSLLEAHRAQKRAERTVVCPQCSTEITFPFKVKQK